MYRTLPQWQANGHVPKCLLLRGFTVYSYCDTDNFPPEIAAEEIFRVNLRQESMMIIRVEDSGDSFALNVQGGLPDSSVLENLSEGIFIFRWIPQEITTKPLVFIASDSRNASRAFTPRVEICACLNGGNCTLEGLLTNNATIIMNCQCPQGE